jgi:hypothetical protein
MGSIVRIKAFNPLQGDYFTIWESPDGEGDPTVQYRYQLRTEYRVFRPLPICQTSFLTDTIRIELDTRTVTDWNELDYVQLSGSLELPHGVLPQGTNELVYVPDTDAFGDDTFSYSLSDCPFDPRRQPVPAAVAVSIVPVNDAPKATNYTITVLHESSNGNKVATVDLAKLVTDVDRDELIYTVDQAWGNVDAHIQNSLLLVQFVQGFDRGFEIRYTAMDPWKAVATAFVSYRPTCGAGALRTASRWLHEDALPNWESSVMQGTWQSCSKAACFARHVHRDIMQSHTTVSVQPAGQVSS